MLDIFAAPCPVCVIIILLLYPSYYNFNFIIVFYYYYYFIMFFYVGEARSNYLSALTSVTVASIARDDRRWTLPSKSKMQTFPLTAKKYSLPSLIGRHRHDRSISSKFAVDFLALRLLCPPNTYTHTIFRFALDPRVQVLDLAHVPQNLSHLFTKDNNVPVN